MPTHLIWDYVDFLRILAKLELRTKERWMVIITHQRRSCKQPRSSARPSWHNWMGRCTPPSSSPPSCPLTLHLGCSYTDRRCRSTPPRCLRRILQRVQFYPVKNCASIEGRGRRRLTVSSWRPVNGDGGVVIVGVDDGGMRMRSPELAQLMPQQPVVVLGQAVQELQTPGFRFVIPCACTGEELEERREASEW